MIYQGPIYRPPSEADSLLVQATLGCPHNKCAFCMVYKKGPAFAVRPVEDIEAELEEAAAELGRAPVSLFLPSGDSLAMPAGDLARVCRRARELFPRLGRITVYASVRSMLAKGPEGLGLLRQAGLARLHVGLESGHGPTLAKMKKGTTPEAQVEACSRALAAGLELNLYVLLGLAGAGGGPEHMEATAEVINSISRSGPLTVRLRTLVPKIDTLLLHWIQKGRFTLSSPHQVLEEARLLISRLEGPLELRSDHYTNYLNLSGALPGDRERLLAAAGEALKLPRRAFRADFVGRQ